MEKEERLNLNEFLIRFLYLTIIDSDGFANQYFSATPSVDIYDNCTGKR
jgi:hypothetical protein